jgi:hypothetical protein
MDARGIQLKDWINSRGEFYTNPDEIWVKEN